LLQYGAVDWAMTWLLGVSVIRLKLCFRKVIVINPIYDCTQEQSGVYNTWYLLYTLSTVLVRWLGGGSFYIDYIGVFYQKQKKTEDLICDFTVNDITIDSIV
jgi:hypothetical protein